MYFLQSAFRSIRKNYLMTFASIFVLVACMLIMGSVYLCSANISAFVDSLGENEITAYISDELNEEEIQPLQDSLKSLLGDRGTVEFVSKDKALEEWAEELGEEGSYLSLFEGEDNPLRNEFRICVSDEYLEEFDSIVSEIKNDYIPEKIANISETGDIVDMLLSLRNVLDTLGFWIMLILAIVSWFIVSNTIKLAMYSRRHEINIMKYVGAKNSFIRTPFILEGLIIGVIAAIIAFVLQWIVYVYLLQPLLDNLSWMPKVPFVDACPLLIAYFCGIGLVVGFVSSAFSINKYLKV